MLGKRLINSNSAAAGGSCTTDTLQILGDTSCIAYYKMSDATDESGSYDGTPSNVNFNVAGKFGNAGEFNGSSSHIDFPSPIPYTNTDMTFSCSINLASAFSSGYQTIVGAGNKSVGEGIIRILIRYDSANNYKIEPVRAYSGNSYYTDSSNYPAQTINAGSWYNVTYSYSSSGNTAKIYLNGSLVSTTNLTTTSTDTVNSGVLALGQYRDSTGFFNGKIDQVRIFNKALSSTEVTTLYNEVYCVPTIVPTNHFNPVIYTGNGSTQSITSLNFEPDFTWIKIRTLGYNHYLIDSVRGATEILQSNLTDAESTQSTSLTSFDTNGFTVGSKLNVNANTEDFVSWNWKAGGADVLNEEGTIDSQVSANTDAGFSIVSYTGNASYGQTVGHGLDSAPELVIFKNLDDTRNWRTYAKPIGATKYLNLDDTSAAATYGSFNNTEPTTSVFSTTSNVADKATNFNGNNFIAYCFHSVDGMSRIGSYDGGTITSSNPVYLGFRPAFVMFKTTQTSNDWIIYDNKRDTTDPLQHILYPATSGAEQVSTSDNYNLYTTSNGFYFNNTVGYINNSTSDVIFMAFAEEVFDPNGVTRNATNPFGDASELALYKFEDNANDAEGSYNGTASNVTYATGYIDKAAVFNGSSSYITYSSFLSTTTDNSSASFSIWVKFNSFSSSQVISGGASGQSPPFNIYVYHSAGTSTFAFERGFGGLIHYSSTYNSAIQALTSVNTWYHIAYNYTKSTKAIEVFLNGQSIGTDTLNASASGTITSTQLLGGNSGGGSFNGSLDQVRIFNRTLDSGEVTQLYNE